MNILIRKEHVLCTHCMKTEPINAGNGTPADTLILAYQSVIQRHSHCVPTPPRRTNG